MAKYKKKGYYNRRRYKYSLRRYYGKKGFASQYFNLKADFQFTIWKQNGTSQSGATVGIGYKFHSPTTLNSDTEAIYMYQMFSSNWGDFPAYRDLFNEFKIIGLNVVIVPNSKNNTGTQADYAPVQFGVNFIQPFTENEMNTSANTLILNPFQKETKYFKNIDKKYYSTSVNPSQVGDNDPSFKGQIRVSPAADDTVQAQSPSWNIKLTFYIRFRKAKNN